MVLRIEDLDAGRCRPAYVDQVLRDFETLGLTWDEGPYYQHDRGDVYREVLESLQSRDLVYPCFCSRADLQASAPHREEHFVYPGTCRNLTEEERRARFDRWRAWTSGKDEAATWPSGTQGSNDGLQLSNNEGSAKDFASIGSATKSSSASKSSRVYMNTPQTPGYRLKVPDETLCIDDLIQGPYCQNLAHDCGDYLLGRADGSFSYQLAVVVDDAEQGITSVVRGVDLLMSAPQQVYLQQLLGYYSPEYAHVPLLVAPDGRRLAKRNKDAALDALLEQFKTPEALIGHIAFVVGLNPEDAPASPESLLQGFSIQSFKAQLTDPIRILWR